MYEITKSYFLVFFGGFFSENRIWHLMQIVSNVKSCFLGKIRKISSTCHLLNLPGESGKG